MRSKIKTYEKTLISELAEAISSFNIAAVEILLSSDGKFAVQNEKYDIVISDKAKFLSWLSGCYSKFSFSRIFRRKLNFTIVQCLHCVTGNKIIVFEEGKFPVFSGNQAKDEQSGLVIKSDNGKITGIDFCFLVMKTESPFIYEKRCLRPGL
jgi:ribosome biogenesis protein Nip4